MECTKEETCVSLDIKLGDKFTSLEQFVSKLENNAHSKYVHFYRRDSRTVESAKKKGYKRYLNPDLGFFSVKYTCVHGGREHIPKGIAGKRKKTLRNEDLCPALVTVRINNTGNEFEVFELNDCHNHKIDKDLFEHLPKQRSLLAALKDGDEKPLGKKAFNKRLLKDELQKKTNLKVVKLDDNCSLEEDKLNDQDQQQHTDNVKNAVEEIYSQFEADCEPLFDAEDNFKGLIFCTPAMRAAARAYPETICIDATYRLLNIKTPVHLILVEDGNGESEIVCVGLLTNEDEENLDWFLHKFIKINPGFKNTLNVLADKDWNEREVLKECFPRAKVLISTFHVFKMFQRETITDKKKISIAERNLALELLQEMAFARDEGIFRKIKNKIERNLSERVVEYLGKHWLDMCDEWHPLMGVTICNFMNTSNNAIENVHAKLKYVSSKDDTLEEILDHLLLILKTMEKEKKHLLAETIYKREITNFEPDSPEYYYSKYVSEYAFRNIDLQLKQRHSVQIMYCDSADNFIIKSSHDDNTVYHTTGEKCNCYYFTVMGLPCKHIFAVLQYTNLDLFQRNLVKPRWTKDHILKNQTFFRNFTDSEIIKTLPEQETSRDTSDDVPGEDAHGKTLSQQDKHRIAFSKCKVIASLCSEASGKNFDSSINALDRLIYFLERNDHSIEVASTKGIIDPGAGEFDGNSEEFHGNAEEFHGNAEEFDGSNAEEMDYDVTQLEEEMFEDNEFVSVKSELIPEYMNEVHVLMEEGDKGTQGRSESGNVVILKNSEIKRTRLPESDLRKVRLPSRRTKTMLLPTKSLPAVD